MDTYPSQGMMKTFTTATVMVIGIVILGVGLLLALFLTAIVDTIQSIKDTRQ
jgi:hypothetical protein